jgi:hypothetical protein
MEASGRQRTLLRGMVYFANSPAAVDCLVREISETGARLKFAVSPIVVDTLELQIPTKAQKFNCEVRSRSGDEIDVAFIAAGAAPLDDDSLPMRLTRLEGEIAALKQIIKRLQKAAPNSTEAA